MKVKELVELLQKADGDNEVVIDCDGFIREADVISTASYADDFAADNEFVIVLAEGASCGSVHFVTD